MSRSQSRRIYARCKQGRADNGSERFEAAFALRHLYDLVTGQLRERNVPLLPKSINGHEEHSTRRSSAKQASAHCATPPSAS